MEAVKAVKCIGIPFQPSQDVLGLLEAFRGMVNYCVHVGLEFYYTFLCCKRVFLPLPGNPHI